MVAFALSDALTAAVARDPGLPLRSELSGAACTLAPPESRKSAGSLRTKVDALVSSEASVKNNI